MSIFRVESGELNTLVVAEDPEAALIQAIEDAPPGTLFGQISSVEGGDDTIYFDTERYLLNTYKHEVIHKC